MAERAGVARPPRQARPGAGRPLLHELRHSSRAHDVVEQNLGRDPAEVPERAFQPLQPALLAVVGDARRTDRVASDTDRRVEQSSSGREYRCVHFADQDTVYDDDYDGRLTTIGMAGLA
jgi:hypothetical protein